MKDIPEKFEKIMKKKHIYLKTDRDREQSPAMSDDLTGWHIKTIFHLKVLKIEVS